MAWCDRVRGSARAVALAAAVALPAAAGAEVDADPARPACEADSLLSQIRTQGEALDRRERLLREREATHEAAEREMSLRLQELEELRRRVEEEIARVESDTDDRVGRIADLYGRMPADRAAHVLGALEPELAAQILSRMRRSRAAAVLAELPRAQAVDLSRRMVRPGGGAGGGPALVGRSEETSGAASVP